MIESVAYCRHWSEVLDFSQLEQTCFCDVRCPKCYLIVGKIMKTWNELKEDTTIV